jgi:hypothetical protein
MLLSTFFRFGQRLCNQFKRIRNKNNTPLSAPVRLSTDPGGFHISIKKPQEICKLKKDCLSLPTNKQRDAKNTTLYYSKSNLELFVLEH